MSFEEAGGVKSFIFREDYLCKAICARRSSCFCISSNESYSFKAHLLASSKLPRSFNLTHGLPRWGYTRGLHTLLVLADLRSLAGCTYSNLRNRMTVAHNLAWHVHTPGFRNRSQPLQFPFFLKSIFLKVGFLRLRRWIRNQMSPMTAAMLQTIKRGQVNKG